MLVRIARWKFFSEKSISPHECWTLPCGVGGTHKNSMFPTIDSTYLETTCANLVHSLNTGHLVVDESSDKHGLDVLL